MSRVGGIAAILLAVGGVVFLASCSGPERGSNGVGAAASLTLQVSLPALSSPATLSGRTPKATYADIALVSVSVYEGETALVGGQPLEYIDGVWSTTLSDLPLGVTLAFVGSAYNDSETMIFGGQAEQILTGVDDQVVLPLEALYDSSALTLPRIDSLEVASPVDVSSGTEVALTVHFSGDPGDRIQIAITSPADGGTFSLSASTVTIEGSTGEVTADYVAPASEGTYTHTVRVTNGQDNYVERQFQVQVCSGCAPPVANTGPSIDSLMGSSDGASPTIYWMAYVSDDGGTETDNLSFAWSFDGTATFVNSAVNPSELANYNSGDSGNLKLVVTDAGGLSATASLYLYPDLFPVPGAGATTTPSGDSWPQASMGYVHSLGIHSDHTLWAWGANVYGELGLGFNGAGKALVATQVGTDTDWAEVHASRDPGSANFSVARKTDNSLWSWGYNGDGALGLGYTGDEPAEPTEVTDTYVSGAAAALAVGSDYVLALRSDNTLWSWGANAGGRLGDGTTAQRSSPVQVCRVYDAGTSTCTTPLTGVTAMAAGDGTSLAVAGGYLYAWGYNNHGQLGLGDTSERHVATQVGTDSDWSQVAVGGNTAYALKSDGSLYAWGYNNYGELGVGDMTERHVPTLAGPQGTAWLAISAGDNHALAIRSPSGSTSDTEGTLWAWGYNSVGQLGTGDTGSRATPAQVGARADWSSIAAGYDHSSGMTSDGALWIWGKNSSGQLGLGDTAGRTTPQRVFPTNTILSQPLG